jgi:hypothetical protein
LMYAMLCIQIGLVILRIGDPPWGLYSWWEVEPLFKVADSNSQSFCQ